MAEKRRPAARPAAPPAAAGEADFRAIVENAGDMIYTLDLDGRFTYLSPRAYEVFGYDREGPDAPLGRPFMDFLAPGGAAAALAAVRRRAETPHHRHVFRVEGRRADGTTVLLEVHGGPLMRDGHIAGRVGVCRVLEHAPRADGAAPDATGPLALQGERMRIARGLRDAIAQIVFGVTADRDASESFLADVKRASVSEVARRLRLDDTDLEVLRRISVGASNREIATQVHLSPAAVKDRVRRLMDRLGARRRAELAAHALRLGIA